MKTYLIKYKEVLFNVFVYSVLLFAFVSFFESVLNSIVPITKIIGCCIFLSIFLIFLFYSDKKEKIFILVEIIICIFSFFITTNIYVEFMDWACFFNTTIILICISKKDVRIIIKSIFEKNNKLIVCYLYALAILLIIFFVTKLGYQINTGWGSKEYFVCYTDGSHSLATLLSFALMLLYFVYNQMNCIISKIISLVFIYALMETGARTYLITIIIFIFIVGLSFYRKNIVPYLIISLITISMLFIFSGSFAKFNYLFGKIENNITINSISSTISNGRTKIIKNDIDYFFSNSIEEKIVGTSFSSVYDINESNLGVYISAHCDYIHILIGSGLVGMFIYFYSILKYYVGMNFGVSKNNIYISIYKFLAFFYVLFASSLNGFFNYSNILFGYIMLLLSIDNMKE